MAGKQEGAVSLYPLENYEFGFKPEAQEKDQSTTARLHRMRERFAKEGLRRTVDAVILFHQHRHPHVLVLQQGQLFKLPGGKCQEGEDELSCLQRKLAKKLLPPGGHELTPFVVEGCVGTWYRPNFEALMYPYQPPHVEDPKEVKRLFLVRVPERFVFAVPKNYKLLAVPLFELYENTKRYGSVLASLPQSLSRFTWELQAQAPPAPSSTQ
eukprot:Hpha_TRINITY_DN15448_c2_g3::TRINITY_DN15448_c2_g3_i1::g.174490::m.174490/K14397/NUDT21, CPSF5, CFIM25; cleavage and polyadenylation specificity factor subunit 5